MSAVPENKTIEGNNYTIITRPSNVIHFARHDNKDCLISILIKSDNSISVEWFVCTSEPGTGRTLVKDCFLYLLDKYPTIITRNTKASLIVKANSIDNSRITEISDEKLANYYKKLGFTEEAKFFYRTTLSGSIGNIIDTISNYGRGGSQKNRKTKRRKTKRRRYTKRRK